MKVGILGCGTIANIIAYKLRKNDKIDIAYFFDKDLEKSENLAQQNNGIAVLDIEEMIDNVDLVLEAASQISVKEHVPKILKKGKNVIIMSVGSLMDKELRKEIETISNETGSKIYVPSGAIAGLDAIKAGTVGKINQICLTTRKPPQSLGKEVDKEEILFKGKASQAVKNFPLNINVAATLSIASGIDIDVTIIVDPNVDRNLHQVYVEGDVGKFRTETENLPCESNPKTSVLAAYSAIKLLKSLNESINIGT
jgi:aspartate dehydrogenase